MFLSSPLLALKPPHSSQPPAAQCSCDSLTTKHNARTASNSSEELDVLCHGAAEGLHTPQTCGRSPQGQAKRKRVTGDRKRRKKSNLFGEGRDWTPIRCHSCQHKQNKIKETVPLCQSFRCQDWSCIWHSRINTVHRDLGKKIQKNPSLPNCTKAVAENKKHT